MNLAYRLGALGSSVLKLLLLLDFSSNLCLIVVISTAPNAAKRNDGYRNCKRHANAENGYRFLDSRCKVRVELPTYAHQLCRHDRFLRLSEALEQQ